jgi:exodeoxyribonuclease V beta subunit
MTADRLGIGALVEWLRDQIARARLDARSDLTRRLETDAEAVQVLTVHRSKGLQFPVVYLPEAWDAFIADADEGRVLRLHETQPDGRVGDCVLDVGGEFGPDRDERWQRHRREEAGEELRLLYVGLTRAQCSVVTWWADSARNTTGSALHRMLFRTERDGEPRATYPVPRDPLTELRGRGTWQVEEVQPRPPLVVAPMTDTSGPYAVRTFDRRLDLDWRRTSYSALTAAAHGLTPPTAAVGSEVEPAWDDDEVADPGLVPAAAVPSPAGAGLERVSPMQDLPSGVLFGTTVHAVLEHVDPTVADLPAELRRVVARVLASGQPGEMSADVLADALLLAMQTPLGPLADDRRLLDIAPADRLAELAFELPLTGGDVRGAGARECRLGDLVPLLRRYLPADDPLAPYPDLLAHPALADQSLRGYLNGSIDAVLRVGDSAAQRYLVVDYKTNWLGSVDGPQLRLGDYTPDRMAAAMMAAHYPLQALLYTVAVHRMLRWRQPGYEPGRHLGGVLYLFVRGMAGADTPRIAGVPCGVFSWRPAPELVTACSDLLDRGPDR